MDGEFHLQFTRSKIIDDGESHIHLFDPRKWHKAAPCAACHELLDGYISCTRAHANAVEELKALLDAGLYDQFAAMLEVSCDVRERCETARRAFRTHRREHQRPGHEFTGGRSPFVFRGTRRADGDISAASDRALAPSAADVEAIEPHP